MTAWQAKQGERLERLSAEGQKESDGSEAVIARLVVNQDEINTLAVNSAASNSLEPLTHACCSRMCVSALIDAMGFDILQTRVCSLPQEMIQARSA